MISADQDRRRNQPLRELLDEMIALARDLANHGAEMGSTELEYAHERMEWLAGEIWEQATRNVPGR